MLLATLASMLSSCRRDEHSECDELVLVMIGSIRHGERISNLLKVVPHCLRTLSHRNCSTSMSCKASRMRDSKLEAVLKVPVEQETKGIFTEYDVRIALFDAFTISSTSDRLYR